MKDKIIKIFKQRLSEVTIDNLFHYYQSVGHYSVGRERRVYFGKDVFDKRKKISHEIPEIKSLHRISLEQKDDRDVVLEYDLDFKSESGSYEVEKEVPVLFGLFTQKKIEVHEYSDTNIIATYTIRYGTVEEKLTEQEYDSLLEMAKEKYDSVLEERKKERDKEYEIKKKEDLEKLKNKDV